MLNSLPTIVPKVISPLNYDNGAFWHAVYKPRFFSRIEVFNLVNASKYKTKVKFLLATIRKAYTCAVHLVWARAREVNRTVILQKAGCGSCKISAKFI